MNEQKKRGLGSASQETRDRVARKGGQAPHAVRGLRAASYETRKRVATLGGLKRGEQRRHDRALREARDRGYEKGIKESKDKPRASWLDDPKNVDKLQKDLTEFGEKKRAELENPR